MDKKIRAIYQNNKNLINAVVQSLFVKVGSIVVAFLATPAYMRYFSDQIVLGVWFTLVSIFNLFLSFDLGIGNGLRNRLTESLAQKNQQKTKEYLSSAYISISLFIFVVAVIVTGLVQIAPLNKFLNISQDIISSQILKTGISICVIGLCGQCVFRLITSICYAIQKAAIPSFLTFLTNLTLLIVVWLAPQFDTVGERFIVLCVVQAMLSNLPLLVATIVVFQRNLANAKPSLRAFNLVSAKSLLRLGLTFFLLQASVLLISNCNEILITFFIGPEWTVNYQVYYKIFSLPSTLFFMILTPFWSAITKARTEKRYRWLKNTHCFVCAFAILAAVGALVLVPFVPFIARIWLKEQATQVEIVWQCSLWFALWCGTNMWMHGNCTFANGMEWMKVQKRMVLPVGLLNVVGIAIAATITKSWLVTIQINIVAQLIIGITQMVDIQKGLNKLLKESKV